MDKAIPYINKYLPAAILYFFLNRIMLPMGLLYTTLLTPFFIWWIMRYPVRHCLPLFFIILTPFAVMHLLAGVEPTYYLRSLLLLFSVFVFCLAFWQFLDNCHSLDYIFRSLLLINAAMTLGCLVMLLIPPLRHYSWYNDTMSLGKIVFLRLKMFTYEPSYYSTLFAPIAVYYILKLARGDLPQPRLYAALVFIPLLLSLSFGVILGIAISLGLLTLFNASRLLSNKQLRRTLIRVFMTLALFLVAMELLFPHNVFFSRIANVLTGRDSSFRGRTSESFILAIRIAAKKSLLWGVGLGQVKVQGLPLFREFYPYTRFTIETVDIPNSICDLLATLGIMGVAGKLFLELFFFFRTRVRDNHYRLALFCFIFIYQFTGSYIMNIAEYVIWILAFRQDLFSQFNKKQPQLIHLSIPGP